MFIPTRFKSARCSDVERTNLCVNFNDVARKGLHAKLLDGFTFTMPDTPRNQSRFPQQKAQKPGVGQPIARTVATLSLASAANMDVAIGPYAGKQTGETALLRTILKSLSRGDGAVLDRYYNSFMMIALMFSQGTRFS